MLRAWLSKCFRKHGSKIARHVEQPTNPPSKPPQPKPPQPKPLQSKSPLLELPEEMVFFIISLLPHADRFSATLTCKALYFICNNILDPPHVPASREDKEDFLLRLERDLMATHHYCAICMKLHKFSSLNKPTENPGIVLFYDSPTCLGTSYQNSPSFAENHFAYHHGRAAMNRHFYGAPAGLDPNSLCYETSYRGISDRYEYTTWSSRFAVRIVYDSLFLFGEHTMEDSTDIPSMITRLDEGCYNICPHTTMSAGPAELRYSERAAGLGTSEISRFLQEPGRIVHGSCAKCLTDYTVEITRDCQRPGDDIFYRVKLQTYHDFGQFRSPEEWKWRVWRRKSGEYFSVEPRDMDVYPPRSVFQRYHAAEEKMVENERLEKPT